MRLYKKHVKAIVETYNNDIMFLNDEAENPENEQLFQTFIETDAVTVDRVIWLCALARLPKKKVFEVLAIFGYTIPQTILKSYLEKRK